MLNAPVYTHNGSCSCTGTKFTFNPFASTCLVLQQISSLQHSSLNLQGAVLFVIAKGDTSLFASLSLDEGLE